MEDLIGKKFNSWIVLDYAGTNKWNRQLVRCRCDCGTERVIELNNLVGGRSKSCGMCTTNSLVGKKFNHWKVLSYVGKRSGHHYYNCKCDCGTEREVNKEALMCGKSKSCGCHLENVGKVVNGVKILRCVSGKTYVFECPYCGNEFTTVLSRVSSGHVTSCGCKSKRLKELIGQRFGKLTVVRRAGTKNSHSTWNCICDCGNDKVEYGYTLTGGIITSCGCENNKINFNGSQAENDIKNYILELNPNLNIAKSKCLDGKEIDIYIQELNLGIEYNGSAYHASVGNIYEDKKPSYHRDKFMLAKDKGIHLVSIFDFDWETNQDKIKSYIRDLILGTTVIYARDCELKSIGELEAKAFTEKYHLQGCAKLQKINYGLYYNGELISVMGFGVPRYKKDGFELHRYCVKSGITVVGGASRLLKAFEKEYSPKELLSYSNNDYFTGYIYDKLGFDNDGQTNVDYFWATNTGYFKRSECQPKTLKNKYSELYQEAINNNASSKEVYVMTKLGARKVYRCGNTRWIKKY